MKRTTSTLVGVLALLLPAAVAAQVTLAPAPRVSIAGGPAFPVGDLGDVYEFGFTVAGGIGIPLDPVIARADAAYNRFPADEDATPGVDLDDASVFDVFATLELPFRIRMSGFTPYVLGGAGYMHTSVSAALYAPSGSAFSTAHSANSIAAALGAGLDYSLGRSTSVFGEGRYVLGFGDNDDVHLIPIRIGFIFRL